MAPVLYGIPPAPERSTAGRALGRELLEGAGDDIRVLQSHPELFRDTRDEPRRKQRMAADVEEVVVAADLVDAQELAPEIGDGLFGGGGRHRDLRHLAERIG